MDRTYFSHLAPHNAALVVEIEHHRGFEIQIEVRPDKERMSCDCDVDFAKICTPSSSYFPDCSVFHELLHLRRFLVESEPKLVAGFGTSHSLDGAFVDLDNMFEHLHIVPLELERYPERVAYWERLFNDKLAEILGSAFPDYDKRRWATLLWVSIRYLLPDCTIEHAKPVLKSLECFDTAEKLLQELPQLLGDKGRALRLVFERLELPIESGELRYLSGEKSGQSVSLSAT